MSRRRIHFSTNIDGLLAMSDKDLGDLITASVRDDDGNIPTLLEFKEYLGEEKAKGHKLLPSPECDNFDPIEGCLGHDVEEE